MLLLLFSPHPLLMLRSTATQCEINTAFDVLLWYSAEVYFTDADLSEPGSPPPPPINRRLIPHMPALPVSTCPQITAIHHCWTRRYTPLHKEFPVGVAAVNRGKRGPRKMKEVFSWRGVWELQILNLPAFRGTIAFAPLLLVPSVKWFIQQ